MRQLSLTRYLPNASELVYGCMGLGGEWNNDPVTSAQLYQAHSAVDAALETGISVFDHADIYTRGKAERVFGQVLKERPELRDRICLQSKCAFWRFRSPVLVLSDHFPT